MHSIGDMLDEARLALQRHDYSLASTWLAEVSCHQQFTTGLERQQYFELLKRLNTDNQKAMVQ